MGAGASTLEEEVGRFLHARALAVAGSLAEGRQTRGRLRIQTQTASCAHSGSIRELALAHRLSCEGGEDLFEPRRMPALRLILDETDWVQVADEADEHDDPQSPRRRGDLAKASYLFTRSGTMLLAGFSPGIGERGLKMFGDEDNALAESEYGHKIPMDERLVLLSRVGSGSTSVVYRALDIQEMKVVALKKMNVFERGKRRQLIRELETLLRVFGKQRAPPRANRRPCKAGQFPTIYEAGSEEAAEAGAGADNIISFLDAFSDLEGGGIALMMEFMDGGSLQDIADRGGCRHEPLLASIAYQALRGLEHLHASGQLHRDLKPANILINHQGFVKISDFGIVKHLEGGGSGEATAVSSAMHSMSGSRSQSGEFTPIRKAHTFVGTAAYMSPERIDGREYGFSSDVWSFGLVMVTLAEGRLPVDTTGFWSMLHSIRDMPAPELTNPDWSEGFRDFIRLCLQKDPGERASCRALLAHPFLLGRVKEDAQPAGELREDLFRIFDRLKDHLVRLKQASDSPSTSVHLVLRMLFFAGTDDCEPEHRLLTLSRQLSIPESRALEYAREYLARIAHEPI